MGFGGWISHLLAGDIECFGTWGGRGRRHRGVWVAPEGISLLNIKPFTGDKQVNWKGIERWVQCLGLLRGLDAVLIIMSLKSLALTECHAGAGER